MHPISWYKIPIMLSIANLEVKIPGYKKGRNHILISHINSPISRQKIILSPLSRGSFWFFNSLAYSFMDVNPFSTYITRKTSHWCGLQVSRLHRIFDSVPRMGVSLRNGIKLGRVANIANIRSSHEIFTSAFLQMPPWSSRAPSKDLPAICSAGFGALIENFPWRND